MGRLLIGATLSLCRSMGTSSTVVCTHSFIRRSSVFQIAGNKILPAYQTRPAQSAFASAASGRRFHSGAFHRYKDRLASPHRNHLDSIRESFVLLDRRIQKAAVRNFEHSISRELADGIHMWLFKTPCVKADSIFRFAQRIAALTSFGMFLISLPNMVAEDRILSAPTMLARII